jgi:hypothetical protein
LAKGVRAELFALLNVLFVYREANVIKDLMSVTPGNVVAKPDCASVPTAWEAGWFDA